VETTTAERRISPWVAVGIGVGAAVVGFLPWIVGGMRLPLQNLWDTATLPDDMPVTLLPFSQYALTSITGILVVGAAAAGLALRMLRHCAPRFGTLLALGVVVLLQVVAVVQTTAVVGAGLRDDPRAQLYLAGLVALAVLSIAVGVGVGALYAKAPPAGAIVASGFAAIALSWWFASFFGAVGVGFLTPEWLLPVFRWVAPVALGVAIAVWGLGSVGRVLAAAFALFLLWFVPGVVTGVANAVGNRVMADYPAEMLAFGLGVARSALFIPELALPPLAVAVAVAVVGLLVRLLVRGRRAAASA
jgi:hypothetical protein